MVIFINDIYVACRKQFSKFYVYIQKPISVNEILACVCLNINRIVIVGGSVVKCKAFLCVVCLFMLIYVYFYRVCAFLIQGVKKFLCNIHVHMEYN